MLWLHKHDGIACLQCTCGHLSQLLPAWELHHKVCNSGKTPPGLVVRCPDLPVLPCFFQGGNRGGVNMGGCGSTHSLGQRSSSSWNPSGSRCSGATSNPAATPVPSAALDGALSSGVSVQQQVCAFLERWRRAFDPSCCESADCGSSTMQCTVQGPLQASLVVALLH
jgi:hypothetical protein